MTPKDDDIGLLWLESVYEGSAAAYHLRGTVRRLRAFGVSKDFVTIVANAGGSRLRRILAVWVRAIPLTLRSDILIIRWHPLLAPIMLLAKLLGTPILVLIQGSFDDAYAAHPWLQRIPHLRRVMALGLSLADAATVVHQGAIEQVTRETSLCDRSILVLPNGPPLPQSKEQATIDVTFLPKTYVLFAGSLAEWQGIDVLVGALKSEEWPTGVSLIVAGDGPLSQYLKRNSDPKLIALGRVTPNDVHILLRHSVASLSPKSLTAVTSSGISPFKVMEAGLAERPVIATRVPGQTEYLEEHACGLLVAPDAPDELAHAVASIVCEPDLARQLGQRGKKAVRAVAWEAHAGTLQSAITLALNNARRTSLGRLVSRLFRNGR